MRDDAGQLFTDKIFWGDVEFNKVEWILLQWPLQGLKCTVNFNKSYKEITKL